MARIREVRGSPQALAMAIPGVHGKDARLISVIRPVNPKDDLWGVWEAATIKHIVLFIRENGVDTDMVLQKRPYRQSGMQGLWQRRRVGVGCVPKTASSWTAKAH